MNIGTYTLINYNSLHYTWILENWWFPFLHVIPKAVVSKLLANKSTLQKLWLQITKIHQCLTGRTYIFFFLCLRDKNISWLISYTNLKLWSESQYLKEFGPLIFVRFCSCDNLVLFLLQKTIYWFVEYTMGISHYIYWTLVSKTLRIWSVWRRSTYRRHHNAWDVPTFLTSNTTMVYVGDAVIYTSTARQILIPCSMRQVFVSDYNMVCSALFLQRALYTVHCTNIMHSRKPSFVITPAVFS